MTQHDAYPYLENRGKRTPLQVDSLTFAGPTDDDESAHSSPHSAATNFSPVTPATNRPQSRGSESAEPEDEKEPASGPQRSRSTSSAKADKEKRKRSRVTPEQLVHLERFFAVDRSPTAARRREISELLGMQERQTQIWFQNRRAKAKLQDGKQKGRGGSAETPPDTPPQLATGFEVDLHNLIHEDEPVTIIPCTDLSIGTWRRIATTVGKHDLVAYVCDVKRCLTWFIHSGGFGFKMEIPFANIIDTEFTNAAPGSGLATFVLSQPPIFYLENVSTPGPDGTTSRHWKRCSDWTEGHQASHVLRHDLIGSAVQLAHVLRNLHSNTSGSEIALHPPNYRSVVPASPMELPPPPMAALTGPGYHYGGDQMDHQRRAYPNSGLPQTPTGGHSTASEHRLPRSAQGPSFPLSSYSPVSDRGTPASSNFGTPIHEYPQSVLAQHQGMEDYGSSAPISHGLAPRAYAMPPLSRNLYGEAPRLVQPYPNTVMRRPGSSDGHHLEHNTPSPPLLTTPYHPPSHLTAGLQNGQHGEHLDSNTQPIISGLPGLLYETDEAMRHHQE